LFVDASNFRRHPNAPAEPVLAAWGITTDPKPVVTGLAPAGSESTHAWADFLGELTDRGLRSPLLGSSDGAPGPISAVETARRARNACRPGVLIDLSLGRQATTPSLTGQSPPAGTAGWNAKRQETRGPRMDTIDSARRQHVSDYSDGEGVTARQVGNDVGSDILSVLDWVVDLGPDGGPSRHEESA
jgi:Transposase, Mutator family